MFKLGGKQQSENTDKLEMRVEFAFEIDWNIMSEPFLVQKELSRKKSYSC